MPGHARARLAATCSPALIRSTYYSKPSLERVLYAGLWEGFE
jgi:hypothetical protein